MLKNVRAINSPDRTLNMIQDQILDGLNPVLNKEIVNSHMLTGVALALGKNVIDHGLGVSRVGYVITKSNAFLNVWEGVSDTPDRTMILYSDHEGMVDLLVFPSPNDTSNVQSVAAATSLGKDRPAFECTSSAGTQLVVPGSEGSPSRFYIGGALLTSSIDLTCDLSVLGPGGLDTGAIAGDTVYYLYAINNGGTPALIASVTPPTTGPTGYSDWTYLGGFITNGTPTIPEFEFSNGVMMLSSGAAGGDVVTNNATPATAKTLMIPTIATAVYGRAAWTACAAAGDVFNAGASAAQVLNRSRSNTATVANIPLSFFWCPIITSQTIYTNVTTATTDSVTFRTAGWIENPKEFK